MPHTHQHLATFCCQAPLRLGNNKEMLRDSKKVRHSLRLVVLMLLSMLRHVRQNTRSLNPAARHPTRHTI